MPRYIDADALGIGYANPKVFNSKEYARGWNSAIEIINSAPTVSPDEVRGVGKWIKLDAHKGMEQYKCSACDTPMYVPECMGEPLYSFCPICGANMDVTSDA